MMLFSTIVDLLKALKRDKQCIETAPHYLRQSLKDAKHSYDQGDLDAFCNTKWTYIHARDFNDWLAENKHPLANEPCSSKERLTKFVRDM